MSTSFDKGFQRTIALIGFMGCGKTAIGKVLADVLSWGFADLDEAIEAQTGASIPSLFTSLGETGFRTLEQRILAGMSESGMPMVLSCGGGVVVRETNRILIKDRFWGVWIDVPEDEIILRLGPDRGSRPMLGSGDRKARVHELLELRRPWYAAAARFHYSWRPGESVVDSASRIRELLGL
jgi:shikimate kinase